jgi:hypothetical protein
VSAEFPLLSQRKKQNSSRKICAFGNRKYAECMKGGRYSAGACAAKIRRIAYQRAAFTSTLQFIQGRHGGAGGT